jgi:hypothetical protein
MGKRVILLAGKSGCGKSTLASKLGLPVVSFDDNFDYSSKGDDCLKRVLTKILETLENNLTVVLDGFTVDNKAHLNYIEQELSTKGISLNKHYLFVPNWIQIQRLEHSKGGEWNRQLLKVTFDDPSFEYIDSSQDFYLHLSLADYKLMKETYLHTRPVDYGEVKAFMETLDKKTYDKYYQTLDLIFGFQINGYSQNTHTWEQLKKLVDFKDKTVLDVAPFHGYFSFEIEKAGARAVVGADLCEEAIKTALKIKRFKRSKVIFIVRDANELHLGTKFDIALCLNVFHHFKDQPAVLENLSNHADMLIFEVNHEDVPKVGKLLEMGFTLIYEGTTYRQRTLLIYRKIRGGL